MKITSRTDYYSALEKLMVLERGLDDLPEPEYLAALDDPEYKTLERTVREFLRGLSPMLANSVGARAPSPELREFHNGQMNEVNSKEYRYLDQLARDAGITRRYTLDAKKLKTQVVAGLMQREQVIQNHKQRIKEHGRILQCQMCALYFHSEDTERIKPYGNTRYLRFCKPCAVKVTGAKKIYQGMARYGRN